MKAQLSHDDGKNPQIPVKSFDFFVCEPGDFDNANAIILKVRG